MTLKRPYKEQFARSNSIQFGELAVEVEIVLLRIVIRFIFRIATIKVVKLESGSTVVTFHVIMSPSAQKNTTSATELTQILTNADQAGELNVIGAVANQTIVVRGRYINGCFQIYFIFSITYTRECKRNESLLLLHRYW